MRCILFANGEYGDLPAYDHLIANSDTILCADGGSNYAFEMGIRPDCIIGDLDSVRPEIRNYYTEQGVQFIQHPAQKDWTDLQLAMDLAVERGVEQMVVLGALGKRVDHTLHNLYAGIKLVRQGVKVSYYTPECWVYLIQDQLVIEGQAGDLVSVIALTDQVEGVSASGFEYALKESRLLSDQPYTISNVLAGPRGVINLQSGIVAVFHYF